MTRTVFLLGFMGSGKSYWGRRLSEALQLPYYDLDAHIVAVAGKSIPELFAEHGETGFRTLERQQLLELLEQPPSIVSTGGGTPCFFDNMAQMNNHGRTIYVHPPMDVMVERLARDMKKRPLLAELTTEELPAFIENLLQKRAPFYEQAQFTPEWSGEEEVYAERLLLAATLNNL
ncbi:MAG: shikimate kinase [Saprospiraceae bacterium]|nr:shikimate kinase [Saprospiraceae bacterium]